MALAATSGLILGALAAAPAQADEGQPVTGAYITLLDLDTLSPAQENRELGAVGKLHIELDSDADIAPDIGAVVDVSGSGKLAIASTDDQCTNVDDAVVTCEFGDRTPGETIQVDLVMWVTEHARVGDRPRYELEALMRGGMIGIGGGGVDIEAASYRAEDILVNDVEPGATVDLPLRFRHDGIRDFAGIEIRIVNYSPTVTFFEDYDNCGPDPGYEGDNLICILPEFVGSPGTVYRLAVDSPLTLKVDDLASGPVDTCGTCNYSAMVEEPEVLRERLAEISDGSGRLLNLVADSDSGEWQPRPDQRWENIRINTVANPFDLQPVDTRIDGGAGETVEVALPVRNNGPATAWGSTIGQSNVLYLKLPTGVEFVYTEREWGEPWCGNAPDSAHEWTGIDGLDVACGLPTVPADGEVTINVTVKINSDAPQDDGVSFVWESTPISQDGDLDNNLAALTLNTGASGGVDGTLPVTGASLGWWISGGAAIAAAGVLGVVLLRRRQVALTW
ncbi:hypothetical protein FB566_1924 [Stackebrandtia endophytica]|uniref:LPXTG-motif cell wall-anchored protein n=1 Tax=Stackebrandtia endophytica TaxID=1496996 RepID=A0A543AUY5_9ACTN|nr:DUF11 domain-containing protein [Stackebrandtia endophytica]TQL76396.1 hypothetical protein FB566_1924 [Stackebrandtia endophytica]